MTLRIPVFAVLFMMLAAPLQAAGEEARPETPALLESVLETAPVEIDGQLLFRVRGVSSFPAEQRAEAIRRRIEKVAADPSFPSDGLSTEVVENVTIIMAGQATLMIVSAADAQLEHTSRDHLATLHLMRIQRAIDEYRQAWKRRPAEGGTVCRRSHGPAGAGDRSSARAQPVAGQSALPTSEESCPRRRHPVF